MWETRKTLYHTVVPTQYKTMVEVSQGDQTTPFYNVVFASAYKGPYSKHM